MSKYSVGDKVYLTVRRITESGSVLPPETPFFILHILAQAVGLALTPGGKLAVGTNASEITHKRPPTSLMGHLFENDDDDDE